MIKGDLEAHAVYQALQQSLEQCLARDVPALRRQLQRLQARWARAQPVDRALARLRQEIEASQQRVARRQAGLPGVTFPQPLPVVERREEILAALAAHPVVVVCGKTGSGKTTQLPKLCLQLGRGVRGKIAHTQPRRLAARSLAARMAEELHCRLGEQVGFKVRFQDRVRDSSYIKVMTDCMLLAEVRSDPQLREYDTLIVDEAHERSLNIDFLLGYVHRLLPSRPDLKLIITSATIDPLRFSRHFHAAPVVEVSGRTYPVEIRYRAARGAEDDGARASPEAAVVDAVDELIAEGPGDILVFLPGERSIRETAELLRKHALPQTEILPLYARLSPVQQNAVFAPHRGRRIVLATNVAETSLTVPGIRYVIDTGLARISRYNYRTKVQGLPIEPISQASADQRAGRCGRVAAGVCIRLYDEADYQQRAAFTSPEIQRTNLASVILQMATQDLGRIEDFPFVEPPDARYIRDGYKLLQELGALDPALRPTPLGRRIARLPVDPRLARMLLAAHEQGALSEVLVIVAVLESADPRDRPLEQRQSADEKHALFRDERSDFLGYLKLWRAFSEQARHLSQNKLRRWCRQHFVSWTRMREWIDIHRQLQEQAHAMGLKSNADPAGYEAVHQALLAGLLGQVAMHTENDEYLGARNLKFSLFPGSGLGRKRPRWLVAAEQVETARRYLRTVALIDPSWLEPLAPHLIKRHYAEPHWERRRGTVVAFENVTLYGLPLIQRRKVDYADIDPVVARQLFIQHALVRGEWREREAFVDHNCALLQELEQLEAKSRRRDLIVDEQQLYAFFDQRIPPSVNSLSAFRRWWKQTRRRQPQLLCLRADQVRQHDAGDISAQQFPDSLSVRGLQLSLSYHFEPGGEYDGVCVRIPAAVLNQVEAMDFDWLVPGLRQEKCVGLIKSLPKPLRRHFVPAPDFAAACLQAAVDTPHGTLSAFLAAQLQRMTGIEVPPGAWRPEQLPAHLHAAFEVVDGDGRGLARGRDLARLQAQFADHARQDFAAITDQGFEREDLCEWDFGALPESLEFHRQGVRVRAYPALALRGKRIDLRLFERAGQARTAHREGVLALLRRQAAAQVRDIARAVADFDKQVLWFSTVAVAAVLREDLETAALRAAFLPDAASVRDGEAFHRCLQNGRGRVLPEAVRIGALSHQILQAYHATRQALKGHTDLKLLALAAQVQQQIEALVYPGFLGATPAVWLPHLARYLQAARIRLQQAGADLARDRERASLVEGHWARYCQARERDGDNPQLLRYRWLIEELRVSLFAQSLGTAEKISPQRLDRLWRELSGRRDQPS